MILAIAIMTLLITITPRFNTVDANLKPYFKEVSLLSNGNLDGITKAGFVKDDPEVLARCYTGSKEVRVNNRNWKKLNHKGKILLIAHEVAHCVCGTPHITDRDYMNCGRHFMDESDTGNDCNDFYYDLYIQQMKTLPCDKNKE